MLHSIHRLHMANVKLQGQFNPPSYVDTRIDVYAYLIIAESNCVTLVDTGVGEGNAYIDRVFEPRRTNIAEALAEFGIATADVSAVVNSHLHFDHCGNNGLFGNADVFVQSEELSIARGTRYTVNEWFDYEGARLQPITGSLEIEPGIKLLQTPGHTPGHQSVLVETATGTALIAAQAAYTADEYQRGGNPVEQAHEGFSEQYLGSIAYLKSLGAGVVYFSHDA